MSAESSTMMADVSTEAAYAPSSDASSRAFASSRAAYDPSSDASRMAITRADASPVRAPPVPCGSSCGSPSAEAALYHALPSESDEEVLLQSKVHSDLELDGISMCSSSGGNAIGSSGGSMKGDVAGSTGGKIGCSMEGSIGSSIGGVVAVDPAASRKRPCYGGKRLIEQEDGSPDDYDSADDFDEELFKNAQDRAEVLAMADLDRELILCDRYDRKQRRNETVQLRRELCAQRTQRAKAANTKLSQESSKLGALAQERICAQESSQFSRKAEAIDVSLTKEELQHLTLELERLKTEWMQTAEAFFEMVAPERRASLEQRLHVLAELAAQLHGRLGGSKEALRVDMEHRCRDLQQRLQERAQMNTTIQQPQQRDQMLAPQQIQVSENALEPASDPSAADLAAAASDLESENALEQQIFGAQEQRRVQAQASAQSRVQAVAAAYVAAGKGPLRNSFSRRERRDDGRQERQKAAADLVSSLEDLHYSQASGFLLGSARQVEVHSPGSGANGVTNAAATAAAASAASAAEGIEGTDLANQRLSRMLRLSRLRSEMSELGMKLEQAQALADAACKEAEAALAAPDPICANLDTRSLKV